MGKELSLLNIIIVMNRLFRAFKLEGSFTDNLGNYGNWNAFVTTYITDGKVAKLDFGNQFNFLKIKANFIYKVMRQEGTDEGGAGVGKAMIVYPDNSFKKSYK